MSYNVMILCTFINMLFGTHGLRRIDSVDKDSDKLK